MLKTARPTAVLIVDPDKTKALAKAATGAGYRVIGPVSKADDAIPLLEQEHVAAAFLNVAPGDSAGAFTLAPILKSRKVPFFFTTAEDRTYPRRKGFAEITLLKPVDRGTVEKLLNLVTTSRSA